MPVGPFVWVVAALAVADASVETETHAPETNSTDDSLSDAANPVSAEIEEIIVRGRAIKLIGVADAASQGTVGYQDFRDRSLSRVGELVEVIPGVVATQHSGEGKANQYFLRGFNLDHGTDFSVSVDGVPLNLRTHGHGQGYLDLNFIIPELVERVDFRKGPYAPENGDFSTAGAAHYSTNDTLGQSFAQVTGGSFDFFRAVAALSQPLGDNTTLLTAAEYQSYNGPWDLAQNLDKKNLFAKLTHDTGTRLIRATASFYENSWRATDQVASRAIESGLIGRFGNLDDDLGGRTGRYAVSLQVTQQHDGDAVTDASVYVVRSRLNLFSNFTYFLEDPVNGDEFEQVDRRTYIGGQLTHDRPLSERLSLTLGASTRYDDIDDLGLFQTSERERLRTIRRDSVVETSFSGWGQVNVDLSDSLRASVGARGDYFDVDVNARSNPLNGGDVNDFLLSPSASLAWSLADSVELYANYGRGFHSNDARGTTTTLDPNSGEAVDTVPLLVQSEGAELGLRFEGENFNIALAGFWLGLDSELVFVGDAGTTEPNSGTKRFGLEASLFITPTDWLTLDASGGYTRARFRSEIEDRIPNAVGTVFSAGATAEFGDLVLSARLRHFGSAPLIEDNSVRSDATTLVNAGVAYTVGPWQARLDVLNVLGARENDISYFFESRLQNEPEPVGDIHLHPVEPRAVRVTLRYQF